MSCSWDIVCVDCREYAGLDNTNHEDGLMRTLIKHRDAIAALAELAREARFLDLVVNTHFVAPQFFVEHAGHVLRPINEYGKFDVPCNQDFVCPTCKVWVRCDNAEHWLSHQDLHHHYLAGHGYHWENR